MKKVLIVQTLFSPGGGSAVAAWIIEALKKECSVSLLTWRPPDFEEINRLNGTSLDSAEITIHYINPVLRSIVKLDPDPFSFQNTSYLMRVCKRINKYYDVVMTGDNELDFGRQGIQYIHYPLMQAFMNDTMRLATDQPWYKKLVGLLTGTYRLWMLLSGFSYSRMIRNLTLVNSDWTGGKTKECYGMETITVYPPAPGEFPDIPWDKKESGFVCIGRFHPDKRFEAIIEILTKVKMQFSEIHLHIIGLRRDHPAGRDYYERLEALVQANDSWVFLYENLSRDDLLQIVARQRYGIHAHKLEHFGIAVAEMVRAGCIVFVPDDGGQVEIVGGDERLIYGSEGEAVAKIMRVMGHSEEQISIRSHLDSRKELFTTEKFTSRIREVVKQFCNSYPRLPLQSQ